MLSSLQCRRLDTESKKGGRDEPWPPCYRKLSAQSGISAKLHAILLHFFLTTIVRLPTARCPAQNGCLVVHFRASDKRNCPLPEPIANATWAKARLSVVCSIGHATCLAIRGAISNASLGRRLDGLMQTPAPYSFSSGEPPHKHPLSAVRNRRRASCFGPRK